MIREYEKALEYYERILDTDPYHHLANLRVAKIAQLRDGDDETYRTLLQSPAFVLDQDCVFELWETAIRQRNYDFALEILEDWNFDFIDLRNIAEHRTKLGLTLELSGRRDEAVTYYQEALAIVERIIEDNPEVPSSYFWLGEILVGMGEKSEAIQSTLMGMDLLLKTDDAVVRPSAHLAAMRVYLRSNNYDAALQELDNYLSGPGYWSIEGLQADPLFDPLRDNLQFSALVEKYARR